ncbi:MAG: hypothetical protein QF464_07685 [Myxococcota bacterium]|nr:hypothetical protein [Myxococcota bacterium]
MAPRMLLLATLLALCTSCGPKPKVSDTRPEARPSSATGHGAADTPSAPGVGRLDAATLQAMPEEAPDSICRGFSTPEGFDARGCLVRGAYPGEIHGQALGEAVDFREALSRCVKDPQCTGISSNWYIGAPWVPMAAAERFVTDGGSYACTVLVGGCP